MKLKRKSEKEQGINSNRKMAEKTYKCDECDGRGVVDCEFCDGTGEITEDDDE